jgi:hypothetical protein
LLDFLLCVADFAKGSTSLFDVVSSADEPEVCQYCLKATIEILFLPTRAAWDSWQEDENHDWNKKLEDDNKLPIPLAQTCNVLGATKVDPEADERSNRVEHLPESHDLTTNLWWC